MLRNGILSGVLNDCVKKILLNAKFKIVCVQTIMSIISVCLCQGDNVWLKKMKVNWVTSLDVKFSEIHFLENARVTHTELNSFNHNLPATNNWLLIIISHLSSSLDHSWCYHSFYYVTCVLHAALCTHLYMLLCKGFCMYHNCCIHCIYWRGLAIFCIL
jgi:hypothetical protein